MLRWTVIFLIIAIIAAIFGFGGVASGAASIAKILFFHFSCFIPCFSHIWTLVHKNGCLARGKHYIK